MKHYLPLIYPKKETDTIVCFLRKTLKKQDIKNVVIGLSGGVDSTTSLYLLHKAVKSEHIFVVHMYYSPSTISLAKKIMAKLQIQSNNFSLISIKEPVNQLKTLLKADEKVHLGNIMARIRMIILYDLAKKYNALVCGTENKSEHLLGYFTRFGDEASDIEPILHLYKTQVYQLAKYLQVPQTVIDQPPTAGLWNGQTDEKEFGFTYQEADQVLHLFYKKHLLVKEIEKKGLWNAHQIIQKIKDNQFKHLTPYSLVK